ncbi:MAG: hypothetical protein ACFCUS_08475 [Rubrimonas sp.]|uniref:hypothetical protein n=1 Tax=Rubrimonas sp. TaxID=2036015 RepID=UPI002FDD9B35
MTNGDNSAAWTLILAVAVALAGFVWWLVMRRGAEVSAATQTARASRSAAAGVRPKAILVLARRISADVEDVDQALRELERGVGLAERVIAEGARRSNLGAFVDDVLRRLAAFTAQGRYDESAAAEEAFAEWEWAEAERRAAAEAEGLRLLQAGLDMDLLRGDAAAAARKVARRSEIETPDPTAQFSTLLTTQDDLRLRGEDNGVNLELEVAIEMAKRCLGRALRADHLGAAQNNLGIALLILGQHESGTARLEQAFDAIRAALGEFTRDFVRLDWAMSTGSQGVAPLLLAERANDPAMAARAVAHLTEARDALREGGRGPRAAYCESQLPAALALRDRLAGR